MAWYWYVVIVAAVVAVLRFARMPMLRNVLRRQDPEQAHKRVRSAQAEGSFPGMVVKPDDSFRKTD